MLGSFCRYDQISYTSPGIEKLNIEGMPKLDIKNHERVIDTELDILTKGTSVKQVPLEDVIDFDIEDA